jgi:hypothetical protein
MHFIVQSNTSSVKVLHDGNINCELFHKSNRFMHMFSILLKRNDPFTTTNTKLSMKFFCSSSDILYVVILLINEEMNNKVITFQTLELCFSKAFVSTECCHTISLIYIFKMSKCSTS